jgi:glucosylceramidase
LSDPAARRHVGGISYQWAGKSAVQRTRMAWPEMPIIQSENECGDGTNTWEYAQYVFDLIHHYVTNGADAYVYWNMALPPGGRSTWGWPQNSMITVDPVKKSVTYNPEFYVLKHFSHFVENGAGVVLLSGEWAANAAAFRNPNNTMVYIVRNPFDDVRTVHIPMNKGTLAVSLRKLAVNTIVLPAS